MHGIRQTQNKIVNENVQDIFQMNNRLLSESDKASK